MHTVDVHSKFESFAEHWSPKIVARLNGQLVKAVKFQGEFVWHHHDDEDEMFLVVKGEFAMRFRDRTETVGQGQFIVVPKGVEHCPYAEEECWVLLFEPATTLNTGNVTNDRTLRELETL